MALIFLPLCGAPSEHEFHLGVLCVCVSVEGGNATPHSDQRSEKEMPAVTACSFVYFIIWREVHMVKSWHLPVFLMKTW